MITITVSFKPDESNAEILAQVVRLLAGLKDSITPTPYSTPIETEVKAAKPRKARVYTDEQKAAFRARMIAAREAKAKAEEGAGIDAKAEVDLEKQLALAGAAPVSGSKAKKPTGAEPGPVMPKKAKSIKVPTPRTGYKVKGSPAAQ